MPFKSAFPEPVALITGIALLAAQADAQTLPGWTLVWSDEFAQADNTAPDSTKWGYDIGGSGWGNNELQYYTNRIQNARIEGGNLVIEARAENFGGRNYTSARLLTKNKSAWTYGRIEARIKVPRGQGIWPAFWMLGTNIDAVGWPACGEIDIMENIGREPSTVHGTVHGPGYSGGSGIGGEHTLSGGARLSDDFHVFAIEREENRIRWFIDGIQYFTITPANLPAGSAWVFNAPQFLLLNVAVGGNWPGNPDGTTVFPQRMTVDYVRVYTPDGGGPPGTGLLLDPGFESASLPDWTKTGGNVYSETGTVHGGARSLKVFGQFTGAANDSGVHQDVAVDPGDSFSARGWLLTPSGDRISGANSAWVEVAFRDGVGNILSRYRSATMTSASVAGVWQDFPVNIRVDPVTGAVIGTVSELQAPAGTVSARVRAVFQQPAIAAGSVWFDDLDLTETTVVSPPDGVNVTIDPGETWLGYMHVRDLPENGGAYQFGQPWTTSDLSATFDGPFLVLKPNSISDPDPYWYVGGGASGNPGNKIMDANMYVEKTGSLSGKTVIFTGNVLSNTFTGAHSAVAFIKDLAPDYSSSVTVTAPLVNGAFSISLATTAAAGRHVQYGFETTGVNVWATDLAPFGSVRITATTPDPFAEWIDSFDFSAFTNPDLTLTGDPDGDGRTNLEEFALDGDPAAGGGAGKIRSQVEDINGGKAMVLTVPVLDGSVFAGSPGKSATVGRISYVIEGSNDLIAYDQPVGEITPAVSAGLPDASPGWTYHSFRLDGEIEGPSPRGPRGFLRIHVGSAP